MAQWTVSSLMSLLPRGLAVGPSLSCGGALGLWWVGLPLEAGSELPRGRGVLRDSANHTELTANEESSSLPPLFLRFACEAQSDSQHNLAVQTQGRTILATRTIQPGTELLLRATTEPDPVSDALPEKEHETETGELSPPEEKSCEQTAATAEKDNMAAAEPHRCLFLKKAERGGPEQSKTSDQEALAGLNTAAAAPDRKGEGGEPRTAPPSARCSARLGSKPRRVHSLSSRAKPPVPKPAPRKRAKRGDAVTAEATDDGVTAETTDDGVTAETMGEDQVKVRKMLGDAVTVDTAPDAVTVETPGGRERRHGCETCGKRFFQKSHLDNHRFTHSSHKPFSCDQCGKTYTSKESFRAHQLSHRGERPFPCPLCPKAYGLKRDLKEHLVLHSGLRPFRCPDCGRGFTRRPSLRVHRLIHCERRDSTETRPPGPSQEVQCSVCGKTLANSGSLKNHTKIHTGERPHMCQLCGKSFSQKGNLVAHLRVHNGEQPFTCGVCGRSFSQWKERQRHQQEHSGTAFLCSICGKVLKDANTLKAHEALHSGHRPHPCPHCPKGYISSSKLQRHLLCAHSTERPFACHCGAAYALRQSLTRHRALNPLCRGRARPQGGAGAVPERHSPPQTEHKGANPEEEPGEEGANPVEEPGEEGANTEEEELIVQEVAEIVVINME